MIAAFQPHLFSRTAHQAAEFGAALAAADEVVVLDVYPARERAEDFPGVTGLLVAQAAADAAGGKRVAWLPTLALAEERLRAELRARRPPPHARRGRRRRARPRPRAVGTSGPAANGTTMARLHRLPWRLLAGMLLALTGCALGWLWFRDSSFAAVERVSITGSGSSESAQVRAALEDAGRGQSTLHLDRKALEEAVEPFSSVASLRVQPDFPHDLRVEVVEHEPVASVQAGGGSVPATGGGLVLDGVRATDLPLVTSRKPLQDGRVSDRQDAGGPEGRGGRAAGAARTRRPAVLRPRRDGGRPARRARADLRHRRRRPREVARGGAGAGRGLLGGRDLPRSAGAEAGRGGRRRPASRRPLPSRRPRRAS